MIRTPRSSRIESASRSLPPAPRFGGKALAIALSLLGASSVFCAADAFAAGEKDGEANKLYDAAMNDDYLNVELAKAEKKLNDAIKKCGSDGCTPKVLAKVYLGLGVIHFANNKPDASKEAFVNGLKADASATLDPTFKGAEIDKIFDDAKKSAGGGKSGGDGGKGGEGGKGGDGGDEGGKGKPGGDLKHTPPTEQQLNTPVPIYVPVPDDMGIKKVTLRYKPFGASNWKPLDMQKMGDGWGVEVPCAEVSTTGDLKYYITADDDAGTVATAGSRNEPYKVAIKNDIEGDPPSLPGKKPPKQCSSSTECVPGMNIAGCEDSPCSASSDCKTGLSCVKREVEGDSVCKRRSSEGKPWGSSCTEPSECADGLTCVEGSCQEGVTTKPTTTGNARLNMLSLEGMADFLVVGGRENVCSGVAPDGTLSDGSFVCFYDSASNRTGQFYGVPNDNVAGTNGVTGGFAYAGGRLGIGFDRQITQKIRAFAGIHLGFALPDSYPGSPTAPLGDLANNNISQANGFLPFWGELRLGYNFLGGWAEDLKFRPFAYTGFGIGQVNAGVPVIVCDTKNADGSAINGIPPNEQGCGADFPNTSQQSVNAYQITGLNYIPVGIGTTFGIKKGFGLKAELRVLFMLPTFGVVFQPTIGPVFAFGK